MFEIFLSRRKKPEWVFWSRSRVGVAISSLFRAGRSPPPRSGQPPSAGRPCPWRDRHVQEHACGFQFTSLFLPHL